MLLAALQNVTKHFGNQEVLRGASLQISSGQKIGLIGPNGSGKTTLLGILLGTEDPSDGIAFVSKGVRVGYVPQYVEYAEDQSIADCVLAEHTRLYGALTASEEELARATEEPGRDKARRAYERAWEEYERVGGDTFPGRAQAMLDALGLSGRGDQRIGSLSGGEKNVLALTQALLAEPNLLILDEPGNHLDYLGVAWLEDFLARFKGAVLVVSHNRYLLDRVVSQTAELEDGRVRVYEGGYSAYRATKLRQLLAQQSEYIANQKRLAQLEALVRRFEDITRNSTDPKWGKRLRARRSQLARQKQQAVAKPVLGQSAIRAEFAGEASKANIAVQVRRYSKQFGALRLFEDAEADITCDERVALVGPNGCGKTTLLRDIVSKGSWEHPTIRVGPSLNVGYCAQEQEVLDESSTVADVILKAARLNRGQLAGLLGRFLFAGDDLRKKVADLSGGERNRLQLARLMVLKPNFLILDEPTNHLDIYSCEAIEEALADFEGTLLVVSHDRYFLDKVADRVVEVRDHKLVSYPGNFSEFWHARGRQAKAVGRVTRRRKGRERTAVGPKGETTADPLEQKIGDLEARKLELEQQASRAFARRDHREGRRAAGQLEQVNGELGRLYEQWVVQ